MSQEHQRCVLDAQDRAGIIGENGAGKTTLIKISRVGLYPDDGIVTLARTGRR